MSAEADPRRSLRVLAALAVAAAGGCAARGPLLSPPSPAGAAERDCRALYAAVDARVERHGVRDAQAARIEGFPYLRVNRLLASFRDQARSAPAFEAWVDALAALDAAARRAELANLPATAGEPGSPGGTALAAPLGHCRAVLRRADARSGRLQRLLPARARVAPEYDERRRLLGLYPLTSQVVRSAVRRLHERRAPVFERAPAALAVHGQRLAYAPPAGRPAPVPLPAGDALGVPRPDRAARARLFARFAPVFVVDVASDADRIGIPSWTTDGQPYVDTARPAVYRHLSHTRLGDRTLVQLNYVIWFPRRPRAGPLDLTAGHLDGLTLRVTLDAGGDPLLYETMHNCGCYHMFFPTAGLERTVPDGPGAEPLWVPQRAPVLGPDERLAVYLAHGTHYVQGLSGAGDIGAGARVYAFDDYDTLRSLPVPGGGRRSLFAADALVPGTARAERWLLWPTGIASPGAMRQWGRHATAFVGRRHFDDPYLIARYFALAPS